MKLGRIDFLVDDPLWAKDFYQDILGFELVSVAGDRSVRLRRDALEICLRAAPHRSARPGEHSQASDESPQVPGLVFYAEDVHETANELQRRGLVVDHGYTDDRSVVFTDFEGHWFRLERRVG